MILYNINGIYPDKNFNFVIKASQLGMSDLDHTHPIGNFHGLAVQLTNKSNLDHTHVAVPNITIGNEQLTELIEISESISTITDIENKKITINKTVNETGTINGIKNKNDKSNISYCDILITDDYPSYSAVDMKKYLLFIKG